ncbi:group II intron reverse transcriptase/maturase (plasmid) [Paenibacillus xylanexedens]|uniref:reverse transcriptase/maturase family protein n=1 Tax=Paenibacillus xylanexedens TaxID=528191 RepID=UPI0009387A56|nr:reverse transcriptase/maturase family protein [Paenibacillus xylanexedens]APO48529.1 group II intron reverse transcriptase/maturase [Paenibacillus xylanexedens]
MRSPETVLDNLAKQALRPDYKFQRLYRNLYNTDFYLMAYSKIYAKEGNMTPGSEGETIDGMSLERIQMLIQNLKDFSYQPKPSRRVYIPKKNGGKRPLGVPSFEDKLLQEVIRMILNSIYDPVFSTKSHGFRENRSCHTALKQVKNTFTGVKWFVEGDIKGFFDNIDHHTLINILKRRIDDEAFMNLIWKFLRAGFVENWTFNNTYSGTPQGGIISPVLSNIYLNELDNFVAKLKYSFDKGKARKRLKEYRTREARLIRAKGSYRARWTELKPVEKEMCRQHVKELKKQMMELPYKDPMDDGYRRIQYVRYADDFLLGVIGSKEDCIGIKQAITKFLETELKIELSQEKTLITHSSKSARFLGYDVRISHDADTTKKTASGHKQRTRTMAVELLMPHEAWRDKLLDYKALKIESDTQKWESIHRGHLLQNDDLEILLAYNAEIRGIYNYYKLANDVYKLDSFKHIMEYSMYKTFANKYKTSVRKINAKFRINGHFGVRYDTKKGSKVAFFYSAGFKKVQSEEFDPKMDLLADYKRNYIYNRTKLVDRLLSRKCEWCEMEGVPLQMHHVRKLKDLKGKKRWEKRMIERKRKTLALCRSCHLDLHNGKLD